LAAAYGYCYGKQFALSNPGPVTPSESELLASSNSSERRELFGEYRTCILLSSAAAHVPTALVPVAL